tara:strand:+ start:2037 stop:2285 length:249 start_codon:yes stop_codon:yes gene_type:complete
MNLTELEGKIMTKKRLTTAVEGLVAKDRMSYLEALAHVCEVTGFDPSGIKRLLNDSIKEKLEVEALELRLIKGDRPNKLPGL